MFAFTKGDSIKETAGTISKFRLKIEKEKVSLLGIKVLNLDYRAYLKNENNR